MSTKETTNRSPHNSYDIIAAEEIKHTMKRPESGRLNKY